MRLSDATRRVAELIQPFILENNLILWDIEFTREGSELTLTIYIDKNGTIDISECESLSRYIDPILDESEFDSLPSYTLCVSSAGLERKLTKDEHFLACIGKKIELRFYKPIDGAKNIVGILSSYENGEITIDNDKKYKEIANAKLVYDF